MSGKSGQPPPTRRNPDHRVRTLCINHRLLFGVFPPMDALWPHTKKAPEMDAAAVRGRPLVAVIGFRYAAALFYLNTNRLLFGDTQAVWTAVAADENLPDGPPASSFYIK